MSVFLEENRKLNLSAYREEETCWVGNVLDSFVGVREEDLSVSRVLDVGTGGGFPLLPLAILFPDVEFTGLDATRKKIDAMQRMVDQLQLTNVKLLLGRAEELGHDEMHREQYDLVLSRAVASLSTLLEFMSPFAKIDGHLLCWKSVTIDEELTESVEARMQLNARLMEQWEYELPGDWGRRKMLLFQKTAALSKEFPRGVGEPKQKPL